MNIDFLCTDGSPIGICPDCLYGDEYRYGVGGSELYLFTLCEGLAQRGHTIRLYNDPHRNYKIVPWVEQFPTRMFNPKDNRDVLINFRTPNPLTPESNGMKVWLSCDQYSQGSYKHFSPLVDKVVCISPTHVDFFKEFYDIQNAVSIDIPIREKDFIDVEKIPNRLVFTSIPDRGLEYLLQMYPLLLKEIPDLSLVITSDWRLWGASAQNERYRVQWVKYLGSVQYRGALPRMKYIEELSKADVFLYPCIYQELFCISASEAQWAGTYPITSVAGALKTTNMGTLLEAYPRDINIYVDKTVELLSDRAKLETLRQVVRNKARERFSLHKILDEWEMKVFNV